MSDQTSSKPDLSERLGEKAHGVWTGPAALAIGIIENTIILAPMEPLYLPLMVGSKARALLVASCLLLGNVIGALILYVLGAFLAEGAIEPLMEWTGATGGYEEAMRQFDENGFIALFLIGVTPFPFQVGVAAAGAAGYPIIPFVIAVTLSRSIRYYAEAVLVMMLGAKAGNWLKRNQLKMFLGGCVLFAGVMAWMIFRNAG